MLRPALWPYTFSAIQLREPKDYSPKAPLFETQFIQGGFAYPCLSIDGPPERRYPSHRLSLLSCGCSSVDRVLASEAKGRWFDPSQPRHRFPPSVLHMIFFARIFSTRKLSSYVHPVSFSSIVAFLTDAFCFKPSGTKSTYLNTLYWRIWRQSKHFRR
jgi:hypothetical protein